MTDVQKLKLKLQNAKNAYLRTRAKNRKSLKHNNNALIIDDITSVFTRADDEDTGINDVYAIAFAQEMSCFR